MLTVTLSDDGTYENELSHAIMMLQSRTWRLDALFGAGLSWYGIYRICLQKRLASGSRDDEGYTELLNAAKFNDVVQVQEERATQP